MCDNDGVEEGRFRSACDAVSNVGSGTIKGGRLVTKACNQGGGHAYGHYWWYADEYDNQKTS